MKLPTCFAEMSRLEVRNRTGLSRSLLASPLKRFLKDQIHLNPHRFLAFNWLSNKSAIEII